MAAALAAAWKELTADESQISWILFHADGKALNQLPSGSELEALKAALKDDAVFFGAIKVNAVDKRDAKLSSTRARYIAFSFVGEEVKGLKKISALNHKDAVQKAFHGHAVWNEWSEPSDLAAAAIAKQLLACGGAHKPSHYHVADVALAVADLDGDQGDSFKNDKVEAIRDQVDEEKSEELVYNGPAMNPREAFQDLYNQKTPTNWILLGFKGKSPEPTLIAAGEGGWTELNKWFDNNQILFACFNVRALGQEGGMEINRLLHVQIDFVGSGVKGLQKARALQAKNSLRDVFTGITYQESYSDVNELDVDRIAKGLWAQVGGDLKPDRFDFGGDLVIPCSVEMQLQQ